MCAFSALFSSLCKLERRNMGLDLVWLLFNLKGVQAFWTTLIFYFHFVFVQIMQAWMTEVWVKFQSKLTFSLILALGSIKWQQKVTSLIEKMFYLLVFVFCLVNHELCGLLQWLLPMIWSGPLHQECLDHLLRWTLLDPT